MLGAWFRIGSAQSDRGAGVSGTVPRPEPGEAAAGAGRATKLYLSFERTGERLAGRANGACRADGQVRGKAGTATADCHRGPGYDHPRKPPGSGLLPL